LSLKISAFVKLTGKLFNIPKLGFFVADAPKSEARLINSYSTWIVLFCDSLGLSMASNTSLYDSQAANFQQSAYYAQQRSSVSGLCHFRNTDSVMSMENFELDLCADTGTAFARWERLSKPSLNY
jgi:hypothetical protein